MGLSARVREQSVSKATPRTYVSGTGNELLDTLMREPQERR